MSPYERLHHVQHFYSSGNMLFKGEEEDLPNLVASTVGHLLVVVLGVVSLNHFPFYYKVFCMRTEPMTEHWGHHIHTACWMAFGNPQIEVGEGGLGCHRRQSSEKRALQGYPSGMVNMMKMEVSWDR